MRSHDNARLARASPRRHPPAPRTSSGNTSLEFHTLATAHEARGSARNGPAPSHRTGQRREGGWVGEDGVDVTGSFSVAMYAHSSVDHSSILRTSFNAFLPRRIRSQKDVQNGEDEESQASSSLAASTRWIAISILLLLQSQVSQLLHRLREENRRDRLKI
ncbi:hypothetical protein B296_00057754 [Ensete ventricosum]|uniref:Uncharacterized protein n=1 Tax=Ensete ventricosum TaxID=4639 RepID=A0A426WXI3_ENSVE|nr:hypothetical protein B296_00057754 [Ensete ventricosum]